MYRDARFHWGTVLFLSVLLSSCAGASSPNGVGASSMEKPASTETPVPAESNPPGDIPDNQVFVPYRSKTGHFEVTVPEGWARHSGASVVSFADKLNTVTLAWTPASSAPTLATAESNEVPQLQESEPAFRLEDVKAVSLPAGPAVLIGFQEDSAPNPVTGKQYRLEVLRYEFFRDGTEVTLTLSSPVGADNVDPWRIISESFRWL